MDKQWCELMLKVAEMQMDIQHQSRKVLEDIRDQLECLNENLKNLAMANEPDPDADQDPFQTLNGPRL